MENPFDPKEVDEVMESLNPATPLYPPILGEAKYQWSKMIKDEQFVIRSNDFTEFKELKKNIDSILTNRQANSAQQTAVDGLTALCPIHAVEMKAKYWDDGGVSYSHLVPNVGWCNGKKINPLKK